MAAKKVTVTIPEDLLEEIREDAAERGISAYVTEALRAQRGRDKLLGLVSWLDEEYGPPTEEELAAARAELDGLDAEFDRRRADSRPGQGSPAAAA
ncbi:ribbon-helix-helix domain-containing protein [Streptomyces sp. NPDC058220]|uniref:ribbon-helix-helix domain-containing protein n=1 Tax=unclassified Streptomyces TaxID=2593676 RepID=UPI0036E82D26